MQRYEYPFADSQNRVFRTFYSFFNNNNDDLLIFQQKYSQEIYKIISVVGSPPKPNKET